MAYSNKHKGPAAVERGRAWLKSRRDAEKNWAQMDLNRHLENRPNERTFPWLGASNFAYALCDMVIDDWKPQFAGSLIGKERIVQLTGLTDDLFAAGGRAATWYDFRLRNFSNLKREIKFASDPFCHLGSTYVKVSWDFDKSTPRFLHIPHLFIIREPASQWLKEDREFFHVMHIDTDFVRQHFGVKLGVKGIDSLIDVATAPEDDRDVDQEGHEDDVYKRVGIDRTCDYESESEDGKREPGQIVLWEHHFEEDGKWYLETISPDLPEFDLKDRRPYDPGYKNEPMVVEGRREYKEKRQNSSRGWTELLTEPQEFYGAMIRAMHNKMVLSQAPYFYAEDGLPDGATQNFSFGPNEIIPYNIQPVSMPGLEAEWFQMADMMRSYGEQRGKKPDFGLKTDSQSGDPRTKFEIQQIMQTNMNSASLVLDNWDDMLTEVLRIGWNLTVSHRDEIKSLAFIDAGKPQQLDLEALSDEYLFSVTSSAEILNRQLKMQKRLQVYQMSIGKPYAREHTAFKRAVEALDPDIADQIYVEPAVAGAEEQQKALLDIESIVRVGAQPQVQEQADPKVRAATALAWLDKPGNIKGASVQSVASVVGYGKAYATILQKTDPGTAAQLQQIFDGIQRGMTAGMMQPATGAQPQQMRVA